jgi:putative phosphoesterase
MKIGVVSDVHNNVDALTYALEQMRGCDVLLCLGDLVSDYRVTPEIVRLAEAAGMLGIVGNHEKTILLHPGSQLRYKLAAEDLAYLEALPAERELELDGRRVQVVHGSSWDDPTDYRCTYVTPYDTAAIKRLGDTNADVLLLGHTHLSMAVRTGATLAINPGSCGEARDVARRLSYAELDFSAGVATIFEIKQGQPPEPITRAEL